MQNFVKNTLLAVMVIMVGTFAYNYVDMKMAQDAEEASYVYESIHAQEQGAKVHTLNWERKQVRSWERRPDVKGAHVHTPSGWVHMTFFRNGEHLTTFSDGHAVTSWGTVYPAAKRKGDYTFF